ncbi:ATP-binding protein [Pandoraea sputorum]|uniref:ATP-binding protein n=1 Tax=Pandoraea sputorum TaxID=93222 RepID=UPI00124004C0
MITAGQLHQRFGPVGAGLGLAIARTIAQAHDGSLILSNRPGGGLRAELHLPVAGPEIALDIHTK